MESDGLSSAEQQLIRESWQKVSASPLEHGTVLFSRYMNSDENKRKEQQPPTCPPLGQVGQMGWRVKEAAPLGSSCLCPSKPRLFDLDPDLLPLFQYNCKKFSTPEECLSSPEFLEHIRKVMSVIDAAVTHLENLHCLAEYLANLGRKHQAVGVKLESFSTVGESLLYMLEKCHGSDFNMNVRVAWTKLYSTVVKAMSYGWDVPGKVEENSG